MAVSTNCRSSKLLAHGRLGCPAGKSVHIVDEASKLQDIRGTLETVSPLDTCVRSSEMAEGRCQQDEKTLQRALEADARKLLDIPGEAHEQVGSVEARGRYFEEPLAESAGAQSSVN